MRKNTSPCLSACVCVCVCLLMCDRVYLHVLHYVRVGSINTRCSKVAVQATKEKGQMSGKWEKKG